MIHWELVERVLVVRSTAAPDFDALAEIVRTAGQRAGRRLIMVQSSPTSGGVSVHHVGRDAATAPARYIAALREHVDEIHSVTPGGGVAGSLLRGLVSVATKFGTTPQVLHADEDALIEAMRLRGVNAAAVRACIARLPGP